MRVALFSDFFYPTVGGTERAVEDCYRMLVGRGHEVTLFAPSFGRTDDPVPVTRVKALNLPNPDGHRFVIPTRALATHIAAGKFDIVHSHSEAGLGATASRVARQLGIPHAHTAHTLLPELVENDPALALSGVALARLLYGRQPLADTARTALAAEPDWRKRQAWSVLLRFLGSTSGVLVPSHHLHERLERYGLPVPSYYHPNAAALAPASAAADHPLPPAEVRIICVGRVSREKRQAELIGAFAQADIAGGQLVIVGGGPALEANQRLARELALGDRVVFTGSQPPTAVASLLRQADIFVLASHNFDNQPISILEAIAAGLPVLYCDANLREGLSPANALLTAPDAASLAGGLSQLAADPARRLAMSQASRVASQNFTYEAAAERLESIYRQMIERHASRQTSGSAAV